MATSRFVGIGVAIVLVLLVTTIMVLLRDVSTNSPSPRECPELPTPDAAQVAPPRHKCVPPPARVSVTFSDKTVKPLPPLRPLSPEKMAQCQAAFPKFQEAVPWPDTRPEFPETLRETVIHANWGDDGRKLIDEYILKKAETQDTVVVLEVGSFMGHSIARWAQLHPKVRVIAVDGWDSFQDTIELHYERWIKPKTGFPLETVRPYLPLLEGNGTFMAVVDHLWDLRDRVVLVRGWSPQGVLALPVDLPCPDILYLDAIKDNDLLTHMIWHYEQFNFYLSRFPNLVIGGDDLRHAAKVNGRHHMEMTVMSYAIRQGWGFKESAGRTFLMGPRAELTKFTPSFPFNEDI